MAAAAVVMQTLPVKRPKEPTSLIPNNQLTNHPAEGTKKHSIDYRVECTRLKMPSLSCAKTKNQNKKKSKLRVKKQGRIHGIRCAETPLLEGKQKGVTDGPTDGPTDGRTDRRTDTPSYRDARTHLKRTQRQLIEKAPEQKNKQIYPWVK